MGIDLLFAVLLFLAYSFASGMKRGSWEHLGQSLETGAVVIMVYLLTENLAYTAASALWGNVLFQAFVNRSFGVNDGWL